MAKIRPLNTRERGFENAKRAANQERQEHEAARDEQLARLKAQRLAREAQESGPKAKG